MEVFRGRTADDVWRQAHAAVVATAGKGKLQPSRAGETYELLHVAFEIEEPSQRWVVSRRPAINPAFSLAEVIWMLAGSNDAAVLNFWNAQLPEFAGKTPMYPGAYGYRLRQHFAIDQLRRACDALAANPASRQVVLQLWDVRTDLPAEDGAPRHGDVPCNVCALLNVRDGKLEWTQVMRSNDIYRGLPYNLVQFTVLQEVLAGWLGVQVGRYNHWSNSLHAYQHATAEFSCESSVTLASNTDSLAVDVDRGETLIGELYCRLVKLSAPELGEPQLAELAAMPEAPPGYQNLLRVLAAESARRRRRLGQAEAMASACTNPQLTQVWAAWWQRMGRRRR